MAAPRDYLNIVDIGHILKGSQKGVRVGEHPEFGGVSGAHSKNSHHYTPGGNALDVTDWNDEVIGGQGWKERTASRRDRARQLGFTETLGPGERGHDTHWHLALSDEDARNRRYTKEEIHWMATGQGPKPKRVGGDGSAGSAPSGGGGGDTSTPAPAATGFDALSSQAQQLLLDSMKSRPRPQASQQPQALASGWNRSSPNGASPNGASPSEPGSPYTAALQGAPQAQQGRSTVRPSLMELAGYLDFQPPDRGALNGLRGPKPKADPFDALAGLF